MKTGMYLTVLQIQFTYHNDLIFHIMQQLLCDIVTASLPACLFLFLLY